MTILSSHRILQVASYGWKHAGEISKTCHVNHIVVFLDIIRCYMKYAMWSNQYKKENFFFFPRHRYFELTILILLKLKLFYY